MRFYPSPQVEGCSDHGCIWGHRGGMGTNGGCGCLKDLMRLPLEVRHRLQRNIKAMQRELEELRQFCDEMNP